MKNLGMFITVSFLCFSGIAYADSFERVKPQDIIKHIKDGTLCGPFTLVDKTGVELFSMDKGQCMTLFWKPHTDMPPRQIPLPNMKD